jgi:hypothetical protein
VRKAIVLAAVVVLAVTPPSGTGDALLSTEIG